MKNDNETRLLERAALAAFPILLAQNPDKPAKDVGIQAWQAARAFLEAKRALRADQYDKALECGNERAALKRIMTLDGGNFRPGGLSEFLFEKYTRSSEPLKAYLSSGTASQAGKAAIEQFLISKPAAPEPQFREPTPAEAAYYATFPQPKPEEYLF